MSFKIHLLIVSGIIIMVYLFWQGMRIPAEPTPAPETTASEFSIIITHASWGLNCRFRTGMNEAEYDSFAMQTSSSNDKLQPDNVLEKVSQLCNGKLQCVIPINVETLGEDPSPSCLEKSLDIEYRCFTYDRPWVIKSLSGQVTINCNRGKNKPAQTDNQVTQ